MKSAHRPPSLPSRQILTLSRIVALTVIALTTACNSIGPGNLRRDRFEYTGSLGDSVKRQTLLNIVKMRYLDPPVFLDVGQIVASYEIAGALNVSGTSAFPGGANGSTVSGGSGATYADRPTITYTPLTGNAFIHSLMNPLPADSVLFLIQAGYPADDVLRLCVRSMNGLQNQTHSERCIAADQEFLTVCTLMRRLQLSGDLGFRMSAEKGAEKSIVMVLNIKGMSPQSLQMVEQLRGILQLDSQLHEYTLISSTFPENNKQIAVVTFSVLYQMMAMAGEVDVPPGDLESGRVTPGWESNPALQEQPRLIHIKSGLKQPDEAFVAVPYHGNWFWIEETDRESKQVFNYLTLFFTLSDPGQPKNLPIITIPTS